MVSLESENTDLNHGFAFYQLSELILSDFQLSYLIILILG